MYVRIYRIRTHAYMRAHLHICTHIRIYAHIEVVKDFRYLGAHLTTGSKVTSPTIDTRWDKAIQQLRRLRYCPATVEAKAKAILAKAVEAAEVSVARIAALTAAVIDVFRYRNDTHNVD